mmetsp:Transcript_10614/g.30212  ORF Transcript_10614/g.30212 Transcript_10614/m.30212 type:complete len:257 (+) Transcript_10614:128-898(+)
MIYHEVSESGMQLPADCHAAIFHQMDPSTRGVAKHVSRDLAAAVRSFTSAGTTAQDISSAPASCIMSLRDMCASLELLQWALGQGSPFIPPSICSAAASGGHLDVLKWLQLHGHDCATWNTAFMAASGGHTEALEWAHAQGAPLDDSMCSAAAGGGHLPLVQWLVARGCTWDSRTCAYAARGGHCEVLEWARLRGCPWDKRTCSCAVAGRHLALLRWARSQGCPWDEGTATAAAALGYREEPQVITEGGQATGNGD